MDSISDDITTNAVLLPGVRFSGAIETGPFDTGAIDALDLPLDSAIRTRQCGEALRAWMSAASVPEGTGVIWLSGHLGSVQDLRQDLLKRQVSPDFLHIKPYWREK